MGRIPIKSFTVKFNGKTNVIITDAGISLPFDPRTNQGNPPTAINYKAIWDTGATASSITKRVADDLKLKPIGKVNVNGVSGQCVQNAYLVNIHLPHGVVFSNHKVIECAKLSQNEQQNIEILLGMDIMSMGDFAVTSPNGKTTMSFRCPSVQEIDFVSIDRMKQREFKKSVGRNDPCPCGSGKKFKKCCGQ